MKTLYCCVTVTFSKFEFVCFLRFVFTFHMVFLLVLNKKLFFVFYLWSKATDSNLRQWPPNQLVWREKVLSLNLSIYDIQFLGFSHTGAICIRKM